MGTQPIAVADEFRDVDLGDPRRSSRLARMVERLSVAPELSLPKAMPDVAEREAAYRFLGNEGDPLGNDR